MVRDRGERIKDDDAIGRGICGDTRVAENTTSSV